MSRWEAVLLSDVLVEAKPGFACGEDVEDGVFQFRMNNITTDGQIDLTKKRRVPRATRNIETFLVEPGDVLFNATNSPDLVGKTACFTGLNEPAVFSNHFLRLRPRAAHLNARFLSRWLNLQFDHGKFKGMCRQWVNQATVNRDALLAMRVPLPPLPEQRRISAILDEADELRAKRRAAIAKLDTLTQSIFLDMFGDPATNPKGFPIRALAQFYVNKEEGTKCGPFGSALKKNELHYDGVPVWTMDNIDIRGGMALPFRMWISESKYRRLEVYSVADGDVIISRAGTVGKMCVASTGGVRSIISTNLIRLRLGPDLLPLYFVSLMTYCKGRVGRLKTGEDGALTHMNTGILDTLKFPYPPLEMQKKFRVIVEVIEMQRSRHVAHLTEMKMLFTSLQHRAFRGEL
ncbi:MAG: restriction endonuclease subunit S [Nitrospira sp. CR2.1]|nr:restriction endonuclease subunit S [Nitrospira sp. CR2.1]